MIFKFINCTSQFKSMIFFFKLKVTQVNAFSELIRYIIWLDAGNKPIMFYLKLGLKSRDL